METGRCGVSREPGESQMRLGASLFLREGKKRARLCCAEGGGFSKSVERSWGGGTFFCESIEIFCEMLKRDVYREKLPNIYSSMLNRVIRNVFTILLRN